MAVLTLRGELDAHGAPRLKVLSGALEQLGSSDEPCLVLDLGESRSWTPRRSGRWWVRCAGCARRVARCVSLPETPARRIFEITGLEDVLSVYLTRETALQADPAG